MKKKLKKTIFIAMYLIIASTAIIIDQITKRQLYGKSFSVVGDLLWVDSSFNTGAAFSIMGGARWFFILIAIISSLIMLYLLVSEKWHLTITNKIGIALILGGAIGNLIDRIIYAGVRDFIYLKSINFAIFNFADTFVTIGGVILVVSLIIDFVKAYTKEKNRGRA